MWRNWNYDGIAQKKTHNKARINTKPLNAIQWRHKLASNISSAGELKKETVFSMSEWIIANDKMMLEPVKEMLAVTWRHLNISCSDASIGLFLKVQRTETINPKRNTCGLLFFISCFDALRLVVRFALLLLRLRLRRKRKTVSRKYDKKEVERRIMHVMCCYHDWMGTMMVMLV